MAIRITCPGCETSLTLSEDKRGKKVRCRACEKVLSIPAINGKASKHVEEEEDHEEEAVQDEPRLKVKAGRKNDEDDEDEKSDRPAKKKKNKNKKKKGGAPIILIASLAAVFLLLVGVGAWVAYYFTRPAPNQQVKAQEQPAPPPQPGRIGGDVVKNPKTLLGNIRARGAQIERDAEMVGIVALYHAYCDEVTSPASRNLDGFLLSIKTAPGKTYNAVKNKEYLINFKARHDGGDVVVYESERYDQGYFCFCADKQSAYLSPEQMKAAGLAVPAPAAP